MTSLAQYGRVRAALAEATRIDQVLPLLDEVEHIKLYAKQIRDRQLLADALEFQMKAERRLGEVIIAAKEVGHFAAGRPPEGSERAVLKDAGLTQKLSMKAQRAALLRPEAFDAIIEDMREKISAGAATLIEQEVAVAERRVRKESGEARLFIVGARDVRRWRLTEVRRAAEALAKIAQHLGGVEGNAFVGDCISDPKLREFLK
jgi:hypothetical protein